MTKADSFIPSMRFAPTSEWRSARVAVVLYLALSAIGVVAWVRNQATVDLTSLISMLTYFTLPLLLVGELSLIRKLALWALPFVFVWGPLQTLPTATTVWSFSALAVVVGWIALRRRHAWIAGLLWGAATIQNPLMLLFFLLLLLRSERLSAALYVGGLAFAATAYTVLGSTIPYTDMIVSQQLLYDSLFEPGNISSLALLLSPFQQSPLIQGVVDAPWLGGLLYALVLLGIAVGMVKLLRESATLPTTDFSVAVLALAMLIISPHLAAGGYVMTLIPVAVMLSRPIMGYEQWGALTALILLSVPRGFIVAQLGLPPILWWQELISKISFFGVLVIAGLLIAQEHRLTGNR